MEGFWLPQTTVIGTAGQVVESTSKCDDSDMSVISQPTMVNFANIFAGATAAVASSATPNTDVLQGANGKNFMVGHGVPSLNQIGIPSASQLSKRSGVFPIAGTLPGMATISNIGMGNANVIISGNTAQIENSLPSSSSSQLTFASAPQMTITVSKDFVQQAAAESGVAMTLNNSSVSPQLYTQQQHQAEGTQISVTLADNHVTSSLVPEIVQETDKTIKCSECDLTFAEESQLSYHIFIAHAQLQASPHKCMACPESFLEHHHLQDHIKAVHSNHEDAHSSGTFTCSECRTTFTQGGHLNYHIYMAHTVQGLKTMQHMCAECGKSFMKASVLSAHVKNVHGIRANITTPNQTAVQPPQNEKQFACRNCDKVFKQPLHLKQHTLSTHDKPHKCEECGKGFGRRSDLNRHMRGVHMRERPHSCAKCGWTFAEAGNLKHHMQTVHSKEKNYRCHVCSKCFSISSYLKTHMARVHGLAEPAKPPVVALTTNVGDSQPQPQQQHQSYILPSEALQNSQSDMATLQVAIPQSQVSRCFECGQMFANAALLQNHVMSTHPQPFWCTVCGEGFSMAFQLQTHLQLRHSDPNNNNMNPHVGATQQGSQQTVRGNTMTPNLVNQHTEVIAQAAANPTEKCNGCGMFLEKDSKSHVCPGLNKFRQAALTAAATMAMAGERPHLCTKCGKGFKTATHLKQHVRCVHTKERPHKCRLCAKGFARMSDLNRHVKSVHERRKSTPKALRLMSSKCTECGSVFPETAQLKRHILTVHLHQRPCFKCADCQEGFPDEQAFKSHICHEEERPYTCTVCSKRFSEATQLRRHTRSAHGQHSSQQQHKCFECRRLFTRPVDLNRHVHAVHLKEKPYKCGYCGKYFGLHGNLNKHVRAVHMLEKPHQCVECGKCFAHIGVLKRHLRDIHYYDRRPAHNNPRLKNSAHRKVNATQNDSQPPPQQQADHPVQEVNHLAVLQALEVIQQQEQQMIQGHSVHPQQQQTVAHVASNQQVITPQGLSENPPPHTSL